MAEGSKEVIVSELALPMGGFISPSAEIRVHHAREESKEVAKASTQPTFTQGLSGRRNGYVDKAAKAKLEKLEDAELLQRFQAGEEPAFYVLFERRHKEIYTHCFRMCARDAEKANDAFQDTFVK